MNFKLNVEYFDDTWEDEGEFYDHSCYCFSLIIDGKEVDSFWGDNEVSSKEIIEWLKGYGFSVKNSDDNFGDWEIEKI